MAVCPLCHIEVEETKARGNSIVKDETYYFCSKACKKKFDEYPEVCIKKWEEINAKSYTRWNRNRS